MKMIDYFLPIKGYEQYYQVSFSGKIKSLKRIVNVGKWGGKREKAETIMNPTLDTYGYKQLVLRGDGCYKKSFLVHRLVALHFIINHENKPQINHIDGDKQNNCASNLEWCNNRENQIHAYAIGLKIGRKGVLNNKCRLTEMDVIDIRHLSSQGANGRQIAKVFTIGSTAVYDIIHRRTWKHL